MCIKAVEQMIFVIDKGKPLLGLRNREGLYKSKIRRNSWTMVEQLF